MRPSDHFWSRFECVFIDSLYRRSLVYCSWLVFACCYVIAVIIILLITSVISNWIKQCASVDYIISVLYWFLRNATKNLYKLCLCIYVHYCFVNLFISWCIYLCVGYRHPPFSHKMCFSLPVTVSSLSDTNTFCKICNISINKSSISLNEWMNWD